MISMVKSVIESEELGAMGKNDLKRLLAGSNFLKS